MKKQVVLSLVSACCTVAAIADTSITASRKYADPKLGLTVVAGSLEVPAGGVWTVVEPAQDCPLYQIQVLPPPREADALHGVRARKAELEAQTEQERYPLWTLFSLCSQYAQTNNGVGPYTWDDIRTNKLRHISRDFPPVATNFFLIPAVPLRAPGTARPERRVLAVQLRPLIADGKHWVLYSDGQSERVPVDKDLCAKFGIVIQPPPEVKAPASSAPAARGVISALVRANASAGPVRLALLNRETGARLAIVWDIAQAAAGGRSVLSDWARARAMRWAILADHGDAPVLRYWLARGDALYGAGASGLADDSGRNRGETSDAFSVFGGRAAVRETLQMQPLRPGGAAPAQPTVEIAAIPGVEVKSHPFEEMLRKVTPGALPLAESVPADRAVVFFPKPGALLPLLNGGADFVFQGGALAEANPAAYDLKNRYLDRLALTDPWVRDLLLKSGAIQELAILFPDLFFIDGTDVTILARMQAAKLLKPALGALGLAGLTDTVQEKSGANGKSFWVMDGDMLIISTSRQEIDRIRALRKAGGGGSLGQSAEFRYMLSQMPLRTETRCLCYLSDPFIRRLVSPAVKIGQLRRLVAKGEMESVSAAALLYRIDGQPGQPDVAALTAKGYLAAEPSAAAACTLDAGLAVACPAFGSPARLKTLLENPVVTATPAEADACKAYLENYSRFWRQYFDPIAFRLDDGPGGELQLTTFILPLVDNTIYNSLREVMRRKEDGAPLRLPDLNPKPLLLLSANLTEEAWTKVTRDLFSELLRHYTTLDPAAFDKLGPGIHLAIHDSDPIVTFGAGDALGILGAPLFSGGRSSEMMFIPVLASVLTRPCQLLVELQDPDSVRRMMRAAASPPLNPDRRWEPNVSFYKVEGRDAWVCTISMENIVKVRFGVEVCDRYLILSNLPWSQRPVFGPTREAPLNALALDLHPEAGVLQMAGLFTTACEQERAAAVQGGRYLYPFLACGTRPVSAAAEQCRALFGFVPEHPGRGQWVWDSGEVRSTVYGSADHPVQPEYKPHERVFGMLGGLDSLHLNLQFEDAGLRVITRWKLNEQPSAH